MTDSVRNGVELSESTNHLQVRSPEDEEGDDLFSDCRSEAGEGPASVAGEQMPTTTTPSIRERLNLGVHNNGQEEELLVVTVADPHKVGYHHSVIIYLPSVIVTILPR